MGIDLIEFVMETEDRFGVALDDTEWTHVRTVGDMAAVIRAKLGAAASGLTRGCPSVPTFFQIRDLLRAVTDDATLRVRPGEALVDRLSPDQRLALWKRLPEALGRPPAEMDLSASADRIMCTLLTFVPVCGVATIAAIGGGHDWWFVPPALALGATLVGAGILSRLPPSSEPPFGWRTIGDLTRRLVHQNEFAVERDPGAAAVFEELRAILVRHFGLKPEEVTPSARFVEDLRLD